jgi:hypothetical protein
MERISRERALELVSCKDDYLPNSQASYFHVGEPDNEGWENITYYTNRKKGKYANRDGNYDSWVYVLSNPSLTEFKVGYTDQTPEQRAKQLSAQTSIPTPFEVEFAFNCWNGRKLEGEVHKKLEEYRVNNHREFFQYSLKEIISSIEEIGVNYL